MRSEAKNVKEYLEQLPEDRAEAVEQLRRTLKKNLPKGFEETLGYGMLCYVVPHALYPDGYHCDPKTPLPFISLASQKNFIALYHMGLYGDPKLLKWFTDEYTKRVKGKLDMGKSCIRFKKPEQIPYDLLAELFSKIDPVQWIALYEKNLKR